MLIRWFKCWCFSFLSCKVQFMIHEVFIQDVRIRPGPETSGPLGPLDPLDRLDPFNLCFSCRSDEDLSWSWTLRHSELLGSNPQKWAAVRVWSSAEIRRIQKTRRRTETGSGSGSGCDWLTMEEPGTEPGPISIIHLMELLLLSRLVALVLVLYR